MRKFTIVSADTGASPEQIRTTSESEILATAQSLGCREASVFEGDVYRYSIDLSQEDSLFVFRREFPVPVAPRALAMA